MKLKVWVNSVLFQVVHCHLGRLQADNKGAGGLDFLVAHLHLLYGRWNRFSVHTNLCGKFARSGESGQCPGHGTGNQGDFRLWKLSLIILLHGLAYAFGFFGCHAVIVAQIPAKKQLVLICRCAVL